MNVKLIIFEGLSATFKDSINVSFETGLLILVTDIYLLVIVNIWNLCDYYFLNRKAVIIVCDPFSIAPEYTCKWQELQK